MTPLGWTVGFVEKNGGLVVFLLISGALPFARALTQDSDLVPASYTRTLARGSRERQRKMLQSAPRKALLGFWCWE